MKAWKGRNRLLSAYAGSLITLAWLVPIQAGIATVGSQLGLPLPVVKDWNPIAVGLVTALALWAVVGFLGLPLASPRHVNARSWSAIEVRIAALEARVTSESNDGGEPPNDEVRLHLDALQQLRGDQWPALRWASRTAYVDCWNRIYRAEEALISSASDSELSSVVDRDWLVLEGAPAVSRQLWALLADVTRWLDRGSYLRLLGRRLSRRPSRVASRGQEGGPEIVATDRHRINSLARARSRLRVVTSVINDYRGRNWANLIQLRNQTMIASLATETFGFGLLALAVAVHVPNVELVAGTLYFLVGATVGLLNHVIQLQRSSVAIDDYGLEEVRLTLLPVVSGLAGVAGVIVVSLLASPGVTAVLRPDAANTMGGAPVLPALPDVFNITNNPAGLVFAALFGIAPGLLLVRLRDLASTYEAAIRSTQPSDRTEGAR
jgi:hypothetical protein